MLSLLILVTVALLLYYVLIARIIGIARPDVLFLTLHVLTLWGTLPQLDQGNPTHELYADLLTFSTLVFMVASAAGHTVLRTPRFEQVAVDSTKPLGSGARVLLLIGIGIVVLYYVSVGYSALIVGLQSAITGSENDVANQRLESYAGSRYLFPGYVNQFRNAIVPMLATLLILQWRRSSGPNHTLVSIALGAFAAFSLLGTAQRTAAVFFVIAILIVLWQINPKAARKQSILVALISLPLLALSTFALGREERSSDGLASNFLDLTSQLIERAFGGTAEVEIRGFEYITSLPTANGAEWWLSLTGLLPGQTGSRLPNIIFALSRGSDRGNAQPSLWGSAYHNFGFAGTLAFAALLGIALAMVTKSMNKVGTRNLYEIGGIAGTTVALGAWLVGSPVVPLNQGLPAYILLWYIGTRLRKREDSAAASSPLPRVGRMPAP